MNLKAFVAFAALAALACGSRPTDAQKVQTAPTELLHADSTAPPAVLAQADTITPAADRWGEVLPLLRGHRVGMVVNHTSTSGGQHLVDRALAGGVEVVRVFAPEHGFRGTAANGAHIRDERDPVTGLEIVSLHGRTKRPTREMLAGLDLLVFDIQDIGARFYTYISTMHHVLDAAAEYGVPVVVLDRPNPNGHYVDGPVLEPEYRGFLGMHAIPVVHGLTVGELARMINGEGWLPDGRRAELTVVPVANYRVGEEYLLPIAPSPNLPTQASIYLYPSLCFFEGTVMSVGRGTLTPFEVVGHPRQTAGSFTFTPDRSLPGARYAKLAGQQCYGSRYTAQGTMALDSIRWEWLSAAAKTTPVVPFVDRPAHFDALAGTARVRETVQGSQDWQALRDSYRAELDRYLARRAPYLLYERAR